MAAPSFKQLRVSGAIKAGILFQSPFEDIRIRENFNRRIKDDRYEADMVAKTNFVMEGGVFPPIECVVCEDDASPNYGLLEVIDGHGRYEAYSRARKLGKAIDFISVLPFKGNNVKQKARVTTSQGQLQQTPYEFALVCGDLRDMGLTPADTAKELHKSVPAVVGALKLVDADKAVHDLVLTGKVSATHAIKVIKQASGNSAATKAIQATVAMATAAGKSKAMPKFAPVAPVKPPPHNNLVTAIGQEMASGGKLRAEELAPDYAKLIAYLRSTGAPVAKAKGKA